MGYREMWPGHACCTHLSSVASPPRSIIGFALVIVVGLTGISLAAPPSYTVVDLGTLEEGNSIVVRGLNNNGEATGSSVSGSAHRGFVVAQILDEQLTKTTAGQRDFLFVDARETEFARGDIEFDGAPG